MISTVSPILSLLLSLAAGACGFLFVLNRYLIQMRDGRRKLWIIVGSMAAVGLGTAYFSRARTLSTMVSLSVCTPVAALE